MTLAVILTTVITAAAVSAQSSLDPAMVALWERTDRPVANQEVDRSWLWGPQANHILEEPYTYEPLEDNQRLVAYFDKSRMEINDPSGDADSVWYVTNGRLVWEMMTGRIQIGQDPDRFDFVLPATINVAGDFYGWTTPTYQALGRHMDSDRDRTGQTVIATIDQWGEIGANLSPIETVQLVEYVTYEGGDGQVGHNVPGVFWTFLTEEIDPLVSPANWVFVMGYPLTEAYWTKSTVGGVELDVMVQCFERRCLTYTPTNNDPFKVEMGNVGLHYHIWRHEGYSYPCSEDPRRGFGELWRNNDAVRAKIGCAETYYGGEQVIPTAYEEFEHGAMLWMAIEDTYYSEQTVIVLYDDGTFDRFEDTWESSQPVDDPSIIPPAGLHQPKFGFGKVWREASGVRDRLGWAVEPESASNGSFQRFNYGAMIWRENEDLIWVFYGDLYWEPSGTWEVYEDTFE